MPVWLAIICSLAFTATVIGCVFFVNRHFWKGEDPPHELSSDDPFIVDMRVTRLESECVPQELLAVMLHHRYLESVKDRLASAPHGDDVLIKLDVASAIRNTHETRLLRKRVKKTRQRIFAR